MTLWVNRTVVQAPRNGTTTHTVAFTAATAGSLLVLVMEGAVTHTLPTGWTRRNQALNNTELSVYTKTATAGEASFTTTHNGSNYPVGAVIYEFAAGSTWVNGVSATGLASPGGTNPTLSGLSGTNLLMAASATGKGAGNLNATSGVWNQGVEDVDQSVSYSTTDGYWLGIVYVEDSTATSFVPSVTLTNPDLQREALTFAVKPVAAGGQQLTAAATDAGSGSDEATTTADFSQTVGDSGTGGDAAQLVAGADRAANDAGSGADAMGSGLTAARSATDIAAGGDQASTASSAAQALADAGSGTDSPLSAVSAARSASDSATGVDGASAELVSAGSAAAGDTGAGTDGYGTQQNTTRAAADPGVGTDSVAATAGPNRALPDSGTGSDGAEWSYLLTRAAADTSTGADAVLAETVAGAPARDITVTWGPVTTRSLAGTVTTRTLTGSVRARTLTGTLED